MAETHPRAQPDGTKTSHLMGDTKGKKEKAKYKKQKDAKKEKQNKGNSKD